MQGIAQNGNAVGENPSEDFEDRKTEVQEKCDFEVADGTMVAMVMVRAIVVMRVCMPMVMPCVVVVLVRHVQS